MLSICNLIGWKIPHICVLLSVVIEAQITHKLSSELSESAITIISSDIFNNIENTKQSKLIQSKLRSKLRLNIIPEKIEIFIT